MNYWNQKDIPHKGWQNVGFEDLLKPTHKCEMCGRDEIRYVHTMYHPHVEKYFKVGQVCADHMANDYTIAGKQLTYMKNRTIWTSSKWKKVDMYEYEEKSTNAFNQRIIVFVFCCNSVYHIGFDDILMSKTFDTKTKAKNFLYDFVKKSNQD